MARISLGCIIGIVLFGVGTTLVQMLGHMLYPPPAGVDMRDPAQVVRIVELIPLGGKLMVLLAYLVGAILGGWAALAIARRGWAIWVVLAGAWAGNVLNVMAIPHPAWMLVASFAAPLLGVLIAARLPRPATN